ncbi:MAG: DUF4249 domain-containing protein [Bacteroidota bacterium]
MKNTFYFLLLLAILGATACTDVIDVNLQEGRSQLVVDAWINTKAETQVIKLRRTSGYLDSAPSPIVTGANVVISDTKGGSFAFADADNDGDYTWEPPAGGRFGSIGEDYTLTIELDGQTYVSSSTLNQAPIVDSITTEFREPELGNPEGIYAQFFARDLPGLGDTYWIKTFKNGEFLNKPQEINIAYDAAFSAGAEVDGLIFIPPIREAINRFPDTADDATDDFDVPPYAVGDSILVEIHAITEEAFYFLEQAQTQMTLGDAGIFAEPLANVSGNVFNSDSNSEEIVLGFFTVADVNSLGIQVEE